MKKQLIYIYKLYLFSSKNENDYVELSQEQGQKLAMVLTSDSKRKFILINNDIVNTSAIEQIIRCDSRINNEPEFRELTAEEEEAQKLYLAFKNKEQKLLC